MRDLRFGKTIPHPITIVPSANHGFIVRMDCVTLVFESADNLIASLAEYLERPKETEEQYMEKVGKDKIQIRPKEWKPFKQV